MPSMHHLLHSAKQRGCSRGTWEFWPAIIILLPRSAPPTLLGTCHWTSEEPASENTLYLPITQQSAAHSL
eukprot:scaffold83739_cov18-Tisochrysis_lutea.AAC.2